MSASPDPVAGTVLVGNLLLRIPLLIRKARLGREEQETLRSCLLSIRALLNCVALHWRRCAGNPRRKPLSRTLLLGGRDSLFTGGSRNFVICPRRRSSRLSLRPRPATGTLEHGVGQRTTQRSLEEHRRHRGQRHHQDRQQQADTALLHGGAVQAFRIVPDQRIDDARTPQCGADANREFKHHAGYHAEQSHREDRAYTVYEPSFEQVLCSMKAPQ